jgi:hypothetical protein
MKKNHWPNKTRRRNFVVDKDSLYKTLVCVVCREATEHIKCISTRTKSMCYTVLTLL